MAVIFPPLESASEEGLLAIGGNLDEETLLTAYTQGIFPWPISKETPLTWFSPDPRGILEFKDLHISKSFHKFLSKTDYTVKFNTQFEQVIENCCSVSRKHETGTWITDDIIKGYTDLFKHGNAYSTEVYHDGELIGGHYGVAIGKYFSGESMFYKKTNASKLGLLQFIKKLEAAGISWLDTQMVTPVIAGFGGKLIPREEFIRILNLATNSTLTRDEILTNN